MAADLQDDGFREIQLSGKQLVFLFMAATVVSVVIFLCGVLVGRGVRTERAAAAAESSTVTAAELTTPRHAPPSTPAPSGADPTSAQPPPPVDDLSYFKRLQQPNAPAEDLKTSAASRPPAPKAPAAPARGPEKPTGAAAPQGQGYSVQVAALSGRTEAEAVAKRLSAKGYSAYVLAPVAGAPSVYRVRVGKFGTQREAETVAAKLQKEEQFKPWITK